MKKLVVILSILIVGCAQVAVQPQALFKKSDNINDYATIMNHGNGSGNIAYWITKVNDDAVGNTWRGSLVISEIRVKPGRQDLYVNSAPISDSMVPHPGWKGVVTCNTKPGKIYVIDIAENGEKQGKNYNYIYAGSLVTASPSKDIFLACFERDKKPENTYKNYSNEIIYK